MKTSELEDEKLDYWVAKALEWRLDSLHRLQHMPDTSTTIFPGARPERVMVFPAISIDDNGEVFKPSTLWAHGGPIIECQHITVRPELLIGTLTDGWGAYLGLYDHQHQGPTPLIAAMRALVASKFGEEVADAFTAPAAPPA